VSELRLVIENMGKFGVGDGIRTRDVQIHSSISPAGSKEDQSLTSADSQQVGQNPQPRRNQNSCPETNPDDASDDQNQGGK